MSAFEEVYRWVRRIPRGKVMTYGQIAKLLEESTLSAAAVGWALAQCPEDVPWQRVVNAKGRCSTGARQEKLLAKEGVELVDGALDLGTYRWTP